MAFKATNLLGLAKTYKAMRTVPSRTSAAFATWITEEMRRNFTAGVDPYGSAHAPLKPSTIAKKGNALILRESFALMGSTRATPAAGAGVILRADAPYAHYHLTGTGNMDPRAFFPVSGMPATWRAELKRIVAEEYKR